jgi:hypothetical protein
VDAGDRRRRDGRRRRHEVRSFRRDGFGCYWGFYFGFGLSITCYLVALAIITWQIAALARSEARRLRATILTLAALYTAIGVLSWMFFFAAPLVLSTIVVACLLVAFSCTHRGARSAAAVSGGRTSAPVA